MLFFPLKDAFEMWTKAKTSYQEGKLSGIQAIRFKHARGPGEIIKGSCTILFYCGPENDVCFLKFVGECLQWNFDYKQFDSKMKFKTNEQSTKGTVLTGNRDAYSFQIRVPNSPTKPRPTGFVTNRSATW